MRYAVRVRPGSSQEKVVRNPDGSLTVSVRARPVEGKANEALRELLAEEFGVKRSAVRIVQGPASKQKVVDICEQGQ